MTNPETCWHNVIVAGISDKLEMHIHCVSCETDLTALETRVGKNYEYDIDNNAWVHVPDKKKPRPAKGEVMTRQEGINAITAMWSTVDGEFCATREEHDISRQEMREALHALGVTDSEIDGIELRGK
jgi:hypothetical protein